MLGKWGALHTNDSNPIQIHGFVLWFGYVTMILQIMCNAWKSYIGYHLLYAMLISIESLVCEAAIGIVLLSSYDSQRPSL